MCRRRRSTFHSGRPRRPPRSRPRPRSSAGRCGSAAMSRPGTGTRRTSISMTPPGTTRSSCATASRSRRSTRSRPTWSLFARGRAIYEPTLTLGTGERTDSKELQRREHWLFVGDVLQSVLGPGYSLQIGRLKLSDERRWWWRTRLDGVRFHYDRPQAHLELGATEDLAPKSTETRFIKPDEKDIFRVFGNAARLWKEKQRLDFF